MPRALTSWEVEDLIDQISIRPATWFGKDKLWVRRRSGKNQLALKIVNGQPEGMSELYVRVLDPESSLEEIERYVDWLLRVFTGYDRRKAIEAYLKSVAHLSHEQALHVALMICDPNFLGPVVTEVAEVEVAAQKDVVAPTTVVATAKRSKYLQNLLK